MKRGLRIKDGVFINLNSFVKWHVNETQISIECNNIADDLVPLSIRIKNKHNKDQANTYYVEVNEFKRIKREIEEYMGTQPHENNHIGRFGE